MTLVKIDIRNVASETHPDDRVLIRSATLREASGGGLISTAETSIPLVDGVGEVELAPGSVVVNFQCRGISDTRDKSGTVPDEGTVDIAEVIEEGLTFTPPVVNRALDLIRSERDNLITEMETTVSEAVDGELGTAVRSAQAAATTAAQAATSADLRATSAENTVDSYTPRVVALEALGGLSPESPVDGQTANLVAQPDTLTSSAVDGAILKSVESPTTPQRRMLSQVYGGISGLVEHIPAPTQWSPFTTVATVEEMKSGSGLPSIYAPHIIDTTGVIDGALGRWYCYFSSDHAGNIASGIGMMYADDLMGPWTVYPGKVFQDRNPAVTESGVDQMVHTETPIVLVRGKNDLVMLYHRNYVPGKVANVQLTYSATSTDGINWASQGVALDRPPNSVGNGGTGYAKAYRIGPSGWVALSSFSDGEYSRQAIYYSRDAVNWTLDRRTFANRVDFTGHNDYKLPMSSSAIFRWRGDTWMQCQMKRPSAGASTGGADTRYLVARLTPDLRSFSGDFYPSTRGFGQVLEHEGLLYGVSAGNTTGLNLTTLEA